MAATPGAQGWEINQYQSGWITASAWSVSCIDLFIFTLFFSSHLHLLIGGRLWLTQLRSVYLSLLRLPSIVFAPWPSLRLIGEIMRGKRRLRCFCLQWDSWKIEGLLIPLPCEKVLMLLRAPLGALRSYYSYSLVVSFTVWITPALLLLPSTYCSHSFTQQWQTL